MPTYVNGRRVGVATNGVFTAANTDPVPGGFLWNGAGGQGGDLGAALSWNDMREWIGAREGEWIAPAGGDSTARPYDRQVYWRAYWCGRGECGKAAVPGTSNHGWAIAVDVKTPAMAAAIMRHGARFGWSWDEGRAAGEWWHFRYVGTYRRRVIVDPLTRKERRLVDAYAKASFARRERILDFTATQIRTIRRRAERERNGWARENRSARYKLLTEWLNGTVAPRYLTERERAWKLSFYGADATRKAHLLMVMREQADAIELAARRAGPRGGTVHERRRRADHLRAFVAHRR